MGSYLPVHRTAASFASTIARLFSSIFTGSHAPYAASSVSTFAYSAFNVVSFASASSRVF